MSSLKLAFSWVRKNTTTILLVVCGVAAIAIVILFFWLKIRGFKVSNLTGLLEIAGAKNEIAHLETKRAVLEAYEGDKHSQLEDVEIQLHNEKRKLEKAKLEVRGCTNDEVASRLTELGF